MSYVAALGAFLGFVVLIILHEAGHFAAAKAVGMRVERFYLFFGRTPLRFRRGETEYGIGWIPAGGYVKISGMNPDESLPEEVRDRAYHAQPVWKRIVVIAAGPAVNVVIALVGLVFFFSVFGLSTERLPVIDGVEAGSPAVGVLRPGDRLLAVDEVRGSPEALQEAITRHRCAGEPQDGCRAAEPAVLLVERGGQRLRLEARPKYDATPVDGPARSRLGFVFASGPRVPLPLGESVDRALTTSWFITQETARIPAKLFDQVERGQISGVVGGYERTRRIIITDVDQVVGILALISLSLALINLFPFLPLDGGHIFWAIVEKVRGRAVPLWVMERASLVGIFLVLILFSIGLTNDVGRLIDGSFDLMR